MIMKYYYWIALAVLIFLIAYTVANKDMIIMEHLTSATAGPMTGLTGPAPAAPAGSTGATGPAGDDTEVAALASKLTALQQEVEDMKAQSKAQMSQATAAQAGLQAIT